MIRRAASAAWSGSFTTGNGRITTPSGVLSGTPYSFDSRFEDDAGTNPEELIAAAHAGSFTLALLRRLEEAGMAPGRLHTWVAVTLGKINGVFSITSVHLDLVADIVGADQEIFQRIANLAKVECAVSRLLNAAITLEARLQEA